MTASATAFIVVRRSIAVRCTHLNASGSLRPCLVMSQDHMISHSDGIGGFDALHPELATEPGFMDRPIVEPYPVPPPGGSQDKPPKLRPLGRRDFLAMLALTHARQSIA